MAENLKYLPSVVEEETGSAASAHYYVYDYNGTDVKAAKTTTNYNTGDQSVFHAPVAWFPGITFGRLGKR